jgi:hypothetical protein
MRRIRIDYPRNEASALLGIQNRALLDARQWNFGFWTVSDEADAAEAVSMLGERRADEEWEVVPLEAKPSKGSTARKTEDCETMARAGSWIYVFGSQYGAKEGPLEPSRHFVMRFNESLVDVRSEPPRVAVDLVREPFALHRLINDALREQEIKVLAPGDHLHRDVIRKTLDRGEKKKKKWHDLIQPGDVPVNVEGSTFLHGGHLLLGLRYPVTREGHPILVEIEGIDRLFEGGSPEVIGFRVIKSIGSEKSPAGIRELDSVRGVVHVIAGNLDSQASKSAVVEDHPEGSRAANEHWIVPLKPLDRGVAEIEGTRRRVFEDGRIEGLAIEADKIWYVQDDEQIVLLEADLE